MDSQPSSPVAAPAQAGFVSTLSGAMGDTINPPAYATVGRDRDADSADEASSRREAETGAESFGADENGRADVGSEGEDGAESGRRRKEKGKKKKSRRPSDEPPEDGDGADAQPEAPPIDPEEARLREIDRQIMLAAKPRSKRPRKRNADDIDLDQVADEEVVRLRDRMIAAADEDELANTEKRPATSKLRMLKEVVDTLQKVNLQQAFSDNDILSGVKRFLEPLPDKSLPSLSIQRQLLPILEKMDIDATMLKMSGLGKLMLFYSRCGRVEPGMRRIADRLIESWSRPILQRYASYKRRAMETREIEIRELRRNDVELPMSQADDPSQGSRPRVRIPQPVHGESFRYLPQSKVAESQDASHLARRAQHVKLNHFKRTMKEKKTR